MEINSWVIFVAAIVPTVVGSLWYGPFLFGKVWQREANLTDEQLKQGNMPLLMVLSYVFSCLIAFGLVGICNHELAIMQLYGSLEGFGDAGTAAQTDYENVLIRIKGLHGNSFGHGVLHGVIAAISLAFPIVAIQGMFNRKSWKSIWLHTGYWVISFAIMGGLVGRFALTFLV